MIEDFEDQALVLKHRVERVIETRSMDREIASVQMGVQLSYLHGLLDGGPVFVPPS